MQKVDINGMADAIMRELTEYANLAAGEMKDAVRKVAKEARKEVKTASPKKTGDYSKKWTATVTAENATTLQITVHDKKYQLVHLLENGHQKRNGGRTRPIKHVAPAEEAAANRLEEEIRRRL